MQFLRIWYHNGIWILNAKCKLFAISVGIIWCGSPSTVMDDSSNESSYLNQGRRMVMMVLSLCMAMIIKQTWSFKYQDCSPLVLKIIWQQADVPAATEVTITLSVRGTCGVIAVTVGGRSSILLIALVFWFVSRMTVEVSLTFMRLAIYEEPVTILCWKAVLVN